MAKPRNKVVDCIAYMAARFATMLVHALPIERNYAIARRLGDAMYVLDRRHRTRAIEHLRRSFPDWSENRIRAVARASMRAVFYMGLEALFTTRLIKPTTWRRHIRFVNMAPALRMLLEQERGLIMLTGHYGNWEVTGYTMATLGFPVVAVARPLDNPYINRYVLGLRERTGMRIVDKSGATEPVEQVLRASGVVGFIADQDAGRKGAFVDFFGRKASTYKIIALLAMQYQVPIVVGYSRRVQEGQYLFEVGVQRMIQPAEWADKDDPVTWITQEYTSALEEAVRQEPSQYFWMHRRWKHRPKGEPDAKFGIA